MNIFIVIFISAILSNTALFAGPFKFKDPENDEWIESTDFLKTLKHYKGLGTVYEIEGHGKYQVHNEIAQTTTTNLTSSPPQKQPLKTVLKTLKEVNYAHTNIASFNGTDQITFRVQKGSKITFLYLQMSKKP